MQTVFHLFPKASFTQAVFHDLVQVVFLVGQAMNTRAIGHVVVDRLGKRVRLLEHHADPGAQLHHIQFRIIEILAFQMQVALHPADIDGVVHAVQTAQKGGLATTGRANQRDHFVLADIQTHAMNCLVIGVEHIHIAQAHFRVVHKGLTHGLIRIGGVLCHCVTLINGLVFGRIIGAQKRFVQLPCGFHHSNPRYRSVTSAVQDACAVPPPGCSW